MIRATNLNKYYNKGKPNQIHVINDTTLELPDKGLITFFGPSGSGKTTLLNVLGGLDKATGALEYDDVSFSKYKMKSLDKFRCENIGYVFQNYKLLLNETVYDNLKIALEIIGIDDAKEVDKRIEYALSLVKMYKYRKKKAYALSGGQQQRVSIARALIKNSKIIIADEPTGNLDSQNTIEVMSILKEISKATLVLLVTHDPNLAKYFSDLIFEIRDGKILSTQTNSFDEKLKKDLTNTIYLKDMQKEVHQYDKGEIEIYSQDNDIKYELKLYIKNGMVYIESSNPIKLVTDTNLKILDEHYSDDFKIDNQLQLKTSWFTDISPKHQYMKKFLKDFKNCFSSFFHSSKKSKFLYFCLFLIGCVLCFSIICIITATTIDVSNEHYNSSYYSFINEEKNVVSNTVAEEAFDQGAIENLVSSIPIVFKYKKIVSYNENIIRDIDSYLLPIESDKIHLAAGKIPEKEDEIIVSGTIADDIIKKSTNLKSYKEIIGDSVITVYNSIGYTFTVVGVSKDDQWISYVPYSTYSSIAFNRVHFLSTVIRDVAYEKKSTGEKLYRLKEGKDLTGSNQLLEPYVEQKATDKNELIDKYPYQVRYNNVTYDVVGSYEYDYKIENQTFLSLGSIYMEDMGGIAYLDEQLHYYILEGRNIENKNEIIVPYYSELEIGKTYNNRVVVGRYTGSSLAMTYPCLAQKDVAILENFSEQLMFEVNSPDILQSICNQNGYKYYNNLKAKAIVLKEINKVNMILFQSLFVALFIISLVFIYLIMRSKMIGEIYNIGVLRSLGASKARIYRKFLIENFIITIFSSMIGYGLIALGYTRISSLIYVVNTYNILFGSQYYLLIGAIVLFIFMLLFGMLPIIQLLKRTPVEITMKYDI